LRGRACVYCTCTVSNWTHTFAEISAPFHRNGLTRCEYKGHWSVVCCRPDFGQLSWRKVTFSHLPPEKVTGTLHDLDSKVADVERSGVCGGDPFESENFKEVVLAR
jgi:hypothetical protein